MLIDSGVAIGSGLIVQITDIRALPDSDGWSILVSFEFRYGTWSLSFMLMREVYIAFEVGVRFALGCIFTQGRNYAAER